MIWKYLTFSLVICSTLVEAQDCVNCNNTSQLSASPQVMAATIGPQFIIESASQYLNTIKDNSNIDEKIAQTHINNLKAIAFDSTQSKNLQAKSLLICSGLIGKLGEKKKSSELGKESYFMVKTAIKTDPSYRSAKTAFITAVTRLKERNPAMRFIIGKALGVDIDNEAKEAIAIIESEKWQSDPEVMPLYKSLKK